MKVLVGGAFNAIHTGHIFFLETAKSYGTLVVVVAHEVHNTKPYAISAEKRKKMVEDLHIADKVVIGNESDYWRIVEEEKPNMIALGYDQALPDEEQGKKIIVALHIQVIRIPRHGSYATRALHQG